MNINKLGHILIGAIIAFFTVGSLTSCGLIYEDLDPCTVTYRLRFTYDYNMKYADAFPAEVHSVQVWAYDSEGRHVWSGEAAGDALKDPGYTMTVDLPSGKYSFLCWGGMKDSPFELAEGAKPASLMSMGVNLPLKSSRANDGLFSDYEFRGLFHGYVDEVELEEAKDRPFDQTVTMPLMKDTKLISVMLQHVNGKAIGQDDFTIRIEAQNSKLGWNNTVLDGPQFLYEPWAVSYGLAEMPDGNPGNPVNSLLAELSTSRIMTDSKTILSVIRNTDNKEIIRIPLVQYLLLVKGHYHRDLTDQEYLDRQDEYSMIFFLTDENTWYVADGIYINNWVVVPPQNEEGK